MDLFKTVETDFPFELPNRRDCSAEWIEEMRGYRILVPNGEMIYVERFFDKKISDRSVEYFLENDATDWRNAKWKDLPTDAFSKIQFSNINWKQDHIKLYGKEIPLPRLTAWYGDSGKAYTYSGITSKPNPWNKGLLYLKEQIERCAGVAFNSVLLNWYRDGEDSLNWHADDEKELGVNPVIASANFGETRDFLVRRNDDPSTKLVLPLKHGTLLIMRGELQHHWQHSIPKRKKVNGSRFNLTFRRIGVTQQGAQADSLRQSLIGKALCS
jgi:alkylated DNA repair dioxygenase AlkB